MSFTLARKDVTVRVVVIFPHFPLVTALRLLGYSKRELVGHNISKLIPEPIGSAHQKYMTRYLLTGQEVWHGRTLL